MPASIREDFPELMKQLIQMDGFIEKLEMIKDSYIKSSITISRQDIHNKVIHYCIENHHIKLLYEYIQYFNIPKDSIPPFKWLNAIETFRTADFSSKLDVGRCIQSCLRGLVTNKNELLSEHPLLTLLYLLHNDDGNGGMAASGRGPRFSVCGFNVNLGELLKCASSIPTLQQVLEKKLRISEKEATPYSILNESFFQPKGYLGEFFSNR